MAPRRGAGSEGCGLISPVLPVLLVCVCTVLCQVSSSSAIGNRSSMKAELLHREHPASPLSSTKEGGLTERIQNELLRSVERARILGTRNRVSTLSKSRATMETAVANGFPGDAVDVVSSSHGETLRSAVANDSLQGTSSVEAKVTDGSTSEYLMSISLGTPPQNFVVVADTGSDLTWLQCAPCESCFKQSDSIFDPSLSSTYKSLACVSEGCGAFTQQYGRDLSCDESCQYFYSYGGGSNTSGAFSEETLNLVSTEGDNFRIPDFWFGCSHASFKGDATFDSADGLVGLGQGLISFPSQLGHDFEDKFSYCLVNRSLAVLRSSLLVFGQDASAAADVAGDVEMQFTPILENPAMPLYYYVGLEGITVGGVAVDFDVSALAIDSVGKGGTIFDSGTTYTILPPVAFQPLLSAIIAQVPGSVKRSTVAGVGLDLCYDVSAVTDDPFPSISFKFANSTSWDLRLENSWIGAEFDPATGAVQTVCLAMVSGHDPGISILGSTQQQDFYVLYDRVEKRIGFAAVNCANLAP